MKQRKTQKSAPQKVRTFYDRKVRTQGYSRILSLGKVIPKHWKYVRVYVIRKTDDFMALGIYKLLGDELDAPTTNTNKTNKP